MLRSASRLAVLIGGTVLGIVLLVLLLRSVNGAQLAQDFARANYLYLAAAFVFMVINWVLKVPRWALLFGSEAPGPNTLFGAMNVGYAINSLLPARLGELVRAYWVRDQGHVSMVKTLSTIALERVTDGVTLLVLLLLVAPTVAFPRALLKPAFSLGAIFVAALLAMAVLAYASGDETGYVGRMFSWMERGKLAPAGRLGRQITAGLQVLRSGRDLALVVLYTLIIWAANGLMVWLILRSFHIDVPIQAGYLLTAVLNLGMAVPSSPGYVGIFEYLMVLTLALFHIGHTPALAAALALHAFSFVPVTVVGLIYLAHAGVGVTTLLLRSSAGGRPSPEESSI